MAEALMARRIAERGVEAVVSSAGLLDGGRKSPTEIIDLTAVLGADLSERASRQLTSDDLEHADLALTMERMHLREAALMTPGAWAKTFTLKEIVRRGTAVGARGGDEPMADWVSRLHAERDPAELLGDSLLDDVADPYGGTPEQYEVTMVEIDSLVTALADLIWPSSAALSSREAPSTASIEPSRRGLFGLARRGGTSLAPAGG
jgi:protein-tyrosine phosphatase